jgi:hypothetical protein
MRHLVFLAVFGLTALCGFQAASAGPPADADESTCHGTAVHFVNSPSEAARRALKEEKLVFVLHVSGHFEDPGIT